MATWIVFDLHRACQVRYTVWTRRRVLSGLLLLTLTSQTELRSPQMGRLHICMCNLPKQPTCKRWLKRHLQYRYRLRRRKSNRAFDNVSFICFSSRLLSKQRLETATPSMSTLSLTFSSIGASLHTQKLASQTAYKLTQMGTCIQAVGMVFKLVLTSPSRIPSDHRRCGLNPALSLVNFSLGLHPPTWVLQATAG